MQLSQHYRIVQFAQQAQRSAINGGLTPIVRHVTPAYTEYSSRNPISVLLYALTSLKWNCPPVWQNAVLRACAPRWLREQVGRADIIHVEHPWQFAWVYRQVGGARPIVLGTQNVEASLYSVEQIFAPRPIARPVLGAIRSQEAFAATHATHVLAVTAEDMDFLIRQHQIPPERCTVVPNGVDCGMFTPASDQQRTERKAELGLSGVQVIVFAGSGHRPNIEAVEQIVDWALHWPAEQVCFLVVGTVGRQFTRVQHPRIRFTGSVQATKPYFEAADVAINPMISGSGSNLKQLEFMAMGLPTVATPIGVRGIPIVDGVHGLIRPLDQFPEQLRQLLRDPARYAQIGCNGRDFVQRRFEWSVVAETLLAAYQKVLHPQTTPR